MSTQKRNQLSEIMRLAWQFVRKNGYTMAEALKCAWANMKLKAAMKDRIVKFYFQKVDGSVREAFGTLKESLLPPTVGVVVGEIFTFALDGRTCRRVVLFSVGTGG